MRCIICGPRNCYDYDLVVEAIEKSGFEITEVVSGCAKGVDSLGEKWAERNGIPVKQFKPDWKNIEAEGAVIRKNKYGEYNARAGGDRNQKMADYGEACIAIDHGTNGTQDMIVKATKGGLLMFLHSKDEGYVF